jgi:single stranded DNA-binding protein
MPVLSMADFQQLIILGNIIAPVELKDTGHGNHLATFTVAVTERWFDEERKPIAKTTRFRVSCWNQLATRVARNLKLQDRVLVIGTIDGRAYNGRDTKPVISLEIKARQIKLLGVSEARGTNEDPLLDFSF